jgi:hypothetical protein
MKKKKKGQDIRCDNGTCVALGEYEGRARHCPKQGGEKCHVTRRGWDSQVCREFSFHECGTTDVFYTITTLSMF